MNIVTAMLLWEPLGKRDRAIILYTPIYNESSLFSFGSYSKMVLYRAIAGACASSMRQTKI